jgi:hypothetical protein
MPKHETNKQTEPKPLRLKLGYNRIYIGTENKERLERLFASGILNTNGDNSIALGAAIQLEHMRRPMRPIPVDRELRDDLQKEAA